MMGYLCRRGTASNTFTKYTRQICYFNSNAYSLSALHKPSREFTKSTIDFYIAPKKMNNVVFTKQYIEDELKYNHTIPNDCIVPSENCSLCKEEINSVCPSCNGGKYIASDDNLSGVKCAECFGAGYLRNKYCGCCNPLVI